MHNQRLRLSQQLCSVLQVADCSLPHIRKLRTSQGVGLREAALGGFFMALIQFMVALTYPGVFDSISTSQVTGKDFLITWVLIAGFSILFSLAGAALGHLSFAPLRPIQAKSSSSDSAEEETVNIASNRIDEQSTMGSDAEDIPIENLTEKSFSQHISAINYQFFPDDTSNWIGSYSSGLYIFSRL